jgi:hypothetical protein
MFRTDLGVHPRVDEGRADVVTVVEEEHRLKVEELVEHVEDDVVADDDDSDDDASVTVAFALVVTLVWLRDGGVCCFRSGWPCAAALALAALALTLVLAVVALALAALAAVAAIALALAALAALAVADRDGLAFPASAFAAVTAVTDELDRPGREAGVEDNAEVAKAEPMVDTSPSPES